MFYSVSGININGIQAVNISSYERRYLLSSTESSLVATFYDVAGAFLVGISLSFPSDGLL